MAKQSWKQQMYQSIANSQVQQVMQQQRDQGIAQLQAEFDAWQKQQNDIAQLQAEYDSWYAQNNPQPAQSAPVQTVKAAPKQESIPSIADFFKPTTASGRDLNKETANRQQREDYQRQQQFEQMEAEGNRPTYGNGLNTGIKQLDLSAIQNEMNKAASQQKEQQNEDLERQILNADRYVVDNAPQLTDEQKALEEQIANFGEYQVNKSDPEKGKKKLAAFGWGVSKIPFLASELIANGLVDAGESLGQAGAVALDDLTGHHDDHANLEKVNNYWDAKREQVEDNIQWMKDSQKESEEENPLAYGAGKLTTQAALYFLTNPLFDKVGTALGTGASNLASTLGATEKGAKVAGKVASVLGNQVGQNLQDVALDTLPRYNELKARGMSDDEINEILGKEARNNAIGNAVFGGIGEIPTLAKWLKNKNVSTPQLEDVDNFVKTITRQSEQATQNIQDISKQIPEISDNIKLSDDEVKRLVGGMEQPARPTVNQGVSPSIENAAEDISKQMDLEGAADVVENTAKAQPIRKSLEFPEEVQEKIMSDFEEIYKGMDEMYDAAYKSGNTKAVEKYEKLQKAIFNYEESVWKAEDLTEVNKAKKAADAARQSFIREMKKTDPNFKGTLTGTKLGNAEYRRTSMNLSEKEAQELADSIIESENALKSSSTPKPTPVEGSNPLQTFAEGYTPDRWKTSKFRTNTAEKLGYGDSMPTRNYAYRVYSEAEQKADAIERYQNVQDIANELLNKNYDEFDEVDIKAAFSKMQELQDAGDRDSLRMLDRLGQKTAAVQRESGRVVQASAEFTRNTLGGALEDAHKTQDDFILEPWRSRNVKRAEGNSRIAKALSDMGHKPNAPKEVRQLTHDEVKRGVIAELNKEVGSVEKYFNDNDIEYLTQLAEDKSIPVWQITSEIEHKLNTGNWYSLDESLPIPQPTNRKLQNALNSLVGEKVRVEKAEPTLNEITEQVRNTLGKESADFSGVFDDNDIEYLANLIHEGATKDELAQALDLKLATGSFGISDETLQEVNNIFKQISQYDPNSKQFVEGQAEAYRLLANEVVPNATAAEKFEAWRYMAMLGNPKTMLRNYVGNKTFGVVTGISNNIAAVAEAGIDKGVKALGGEGIQRTKSVLNPVKDNSLIKACTEDADASRYRQMIGSKYEKMNQDTLRKSKSVFNSKLLQLYEKAVDAGISDYSAVKSKFSTSLAGYLKANGFDESIFKAEDELAKLKNLSDTRLLSASERQTMEQLSKDVQQLEKARDYALKQAEYATFHEDNKFADILSKISKMSKEEGTGIGHVLIEGVVPFKKTPANVLRSGYEYSPLGAISSIKKTGKLIYENTGKRAGNLAETYINKKGKEVAKTLASDVIDSWSKTLTGTGLTALGFYLYNKGILHSSDPDTKYQDQLEGHQNYAIEINGKSYTLDWAAPTIMPLMVGAEVAKLWDSTGKGTEDFYNNIDGYLNAANRLADPLIETSMLSGIKDTLETAASAAQYNENLNVPTLLAYNTVTGYATQAVPTIAGQIARTVDPTRRSTYTDKEGVAGVIDKQLKKQMNKIPGLSTLNQEYVDTYGRTQQNSPFNNPAANLAYQMFSPGYLSNINETGADKVSRDAYEVGKTTSTLPKWQSSFKDSEGNRVSPEDYTTASKAYGQANYEIREALANDEWFNSLDDAQKEEIVKGINTIAEHTGKAAIDPEYTKDSKPYNAYKEGGISGLMDYYKEQIAKNTAKDLLGDSGVTTNSNAGKAVVEAVESGNMVKANKLAEEAKAEKEQQNEIKETQNTLSDYGLSNIGPAKTYEKAQSVIPGLTTEKFASTYKKMDNDGNQSIKQDEIISYLNNNNISESEGKKIWEAYGNKTWKKIPVLENGKWKKK